jgi:hypothetical protein
MPWTDRQLPEGGEVFVDHFAHFVPDMDAASEAMARLGFVLSPYTPQVSSAGPGQPPLPAGTANRCALLRRGYLEILTPTADTPLAAQLRAAIARYTGVHLCAFSCDEPEARNARLAADGFEPQPPIALQRETEAGLLRFTVNRIRPGIMPEGRIQFVTHHTPDLLWEDRWLDHPNRAEALTDIALCVNDVDEAIARFSRFTGLSARSGIIETARGRLAILDRHQAAAALPGMAQPECPYFAACALRSGDLDATRAFLPDAVGAGKDAIMVAGPEAVGGVFVFTAEGAGLPWLGL